MNQAMELGIIQILLVYVMMKTLRLVVPTEQALYLYQSRQNLKLGVLHAPLTSIFLIARGASI